VSVPAAASDTCPTSSAAVIGGPAYASLRTIDLQATPAHLPPDQFAALARAVQDALLFPPGELVPGDHYVLPDGSVATASQPLTASLQVTLTTNAGTASAFNVNGDQCSQLCSLGTGFEAAGEVGGWALIASVRGTWQLTDSAGGVVAAVPASQAKPGAPNQSLIVVLAARWDGGWAVAMPTSGYWFMGPCEPGAATLSLILGAGWPNLTNLSFATAQAHSVTDGCLITVSQSQQGTTGQQKSVALVLDRFGVLMAGDDAAHELLPQLPLPSAHERSIIATLAATEQSTKQSQ
jgi:hypothetical protein